MLLSNLDLQQNYSYADYLTWQFDEVVELIKGKIVAMSPSPSRKHQRTSSKLLEKMFFALAGKPCQVYHAPFDVRFATNPNGKSDKEIFTVVQPDICVVCDVEKLDEKGCLGAPDLIIEILSFGTQRNDRKVKKYLYEEFGVKEYWIVSPYELTIEVYLLNSEGKYENSNIFTEGEEITSSILSDYAIKINDIFHES